MDVTNQLMKDIFNQCRDGMFNSELAQKLQGMGEDINFPDKTGVTVLHVACCNGNFVIVQELLKQQHINIEAKDHYQRTVLHAAVLGHKFKAHEASSSYFKKEAKAYFKRSELNPDDQIEVLRILFMHEESSKCFIQQKLNYSLFELSIRANVKPCILQYLVSEMRLKRTVDDCNYALEEAVRNDKMALLAVMAEDPFSDLNCIISDGKLSLLGLAIRNNQLECMKFLLDNPGVDVNFMGRTALYATDCNALMHAIEEVGTEEEKRIKMEQLHILMFHPRIDINCATRKGGYPLHRAVVMENPFFLKTLLAHPEIDVNLKTGGEFSPLKFVAWVEFHDHLDLLLSHPRTIIGHDPLGSSRAWPSIMDIVDYGTSRSILKALAAGGDPNAKAWSDVFKCDINLFELNLILCAEAIDISEMKDRLKAGQILLEAGCHPTVSRRIIEYINTTTSLSNSQKLVLDKLKVCPMRMVQSLGFASRSALFKQARKVKGPYVTCDLMDQLVTTENLPKVIKELLAFDNAIKSKLHNI